MPTPEQRAERSHQADVERIDLSEDVREALASHRLAYAENGRVACYCTPGHWRSLDNYGEHLEKLILETEADPHNMRLLNRDKDPQ